MLKRIMSHAHDKMLSGAVRATLAVGDLRGRLKERQDGATLMEYALLVGGIILLVLAVIYLLGGKLNQIFTSFYDQLH